MKWLRDLDFTLREFIVSGILIIVMIAFGVIISNVLHDKKTETAEEYFKAVKVTDATLFEYALKTSVGNVLAEGTFEAVNPVTHKNLNGKYFYIREVEEHYVQKTRRVSYKCGKRTCYRTETYWVWEETGHVNKHVKQFTFLKRTFKYKQVKFDNPSYTSTKKENSHKRYKYYTIPKSFDGALFSKAKNNDIENTKLYTDETIKSVMKQKEKGADKAVLIFWIIWIVVMLAAALGFMALENRYLNGRTT